MALGGFIACGALLHVYCQSRHWLAGRDVPTGRVMGAIAAVIGLELAGVAANMAGPLPADGQSADSKTIIISLVTLGVTVFGSVLFRGFMAIIPILIGVLAWPRALRDGRGGIPSDCAGVLVRAAKPSTRRALRVYYFHHSACGAGGHCRARYTGSDGEYRQRSDSDPGLHCLMPFAAKRAVDHDLRLLAPRQTPPTVRTSA